MARARGLGHPRFRSLAKALWTRDQLVTAEAESDDRTGRHSRGRMATSAAGPAPRTAPRGRQPHRRPGLGAVRGDRSAIPVGGGVHCWGRAGGADGPRATPNKRVRLNAPLQCLPKGMPSGHKHMRRKAGVNTKERHSGPSPPWAEGETAHPPSPPSGLLKQRVAVGGWRSWGAVQSKKKLGFLKTVLLSTPTDLGLTPPLSPLPPPPAAATARPLPSAIENSRINAVPASTAPRKQQSWCRIQQNTNPYGPSACGFFRAVACP